MSDSDTPTVGPGEPLPVGTGPWRVFISHTRELGSLPTKETSYVAAAAEAVVRAGHVPVHMALFDNPDVTPSEVDREKLATCQVYVGLYGFSWGTPSVTDTERSYTEQEYDQAAELGLTRRVFLLDDRSTELGLSPDELGFFSEHHDKQMAFRRRVSDGRVVAFVQNRSDLDNRVYQALVELVDKVETVRTIPPPAPPQLDGLLAGTDTDQVVLAHSPPGAGNIWWTKALAWIGATIGGFVATEAMGSFLDRDLMARVGASAFVLAAVAWAYFKVAQPSDLIMTWHGRGATVFVFAAGAVLWLAPAKATGPPQVMIMDSTVQSQVYNQDRWEDGGTNADDITEILTTITPDLALDKEATSLSWNREDEVRKAEPDLIIIHASAFYDETVPSDPQKRLGSFLEYMAETDTKFLIYTRVQTCGDELHDYYTTKYPFLRERFDLMCMGANPFWDEVTGRELKIRVRALLNLEQ